jgi:autotransporter-associated beta strand protein
LALLVATAQAQTYVWENPTSGTENWSAASWRLPAGVPPAGGALGSTLEFANGTYTANNDLAGTYKLTTMYFDGGAGNLTLSGNDLNFDGDITYDTRMVNNSSGTLTINNNIALSGNYNCFLHPNGTITFNGVVSGSLGGGIWLADRDAAVVFANAGNNFTCQLGVFNIGTLIANANGAFGNMAGSIQLPLVAGGTGTVALYGGSSGVTISQRINATQLLGAGGTRIIGGLQSSGYVTIANYIEGPAGQAVQFHCPSGAGLQINAGVIGSPIASSSIIYEGGGQFSVYAAGAGGFTYSGTTTVRAGYVYLQGGGDTGSAGNYSLGSSPNTTAVQLGDSLTPTGAPLSLLAYNDFTINHDISVNNYGGAAVLGCSGNHQTTWNGNISLAKNVYLQDYTYGLGATKFNGQISGPGAVITTGNGVIALTAANTYSGGTIVQANAALDVQHDGALGTGSVLVQAGGQLTLESGAANSYIAPTANLVLQNSTATVQLNYSGVNNIAGISFDNGSTWVADGTWGAPGSGAAHTSAVFSGSGLLNVNNSMAGNSSTNTLARVMNAAYAPGLHVDGTGSVWTGLASSTLYMDTTPNSTLPNNNLGVNIRYAWDYTNLFILVAENTNVVTSTNQVEAPDEDSYLAGPWSFDTIAFWVDLKNTCGLISHGVQIAKANADFQPWFGFNSAGVPGLLYARANNTTTIDTNGLAHAKVFTSGNFAAHNRKVEVAIAWADIAADVDPSQQPGGSIAAAVAPGLKIGSEPLLVNNYWDGQSFIGAGNKWNPPSGADTNSVDVQLISLTAPPSLTVQLESGQVVLRWPAAALNYTLWSSPVLGVGASWTQVGTAPAADPGNPALLKVSLPPSGSGQYYRLKQ